MHLSSANWEQIKNDIAYSDHPVKLIGISAGVSYGALGSTHHSLHDYAVLRTVHNIDIIAPADNFETHEAIRAAAAHPRPVYIRLGKKPMLNLHPAGTDFEIGRAIIIHEGSDVSFIAAGETVHRALLAAQDLEKEGISCRVISMHTIKPLDTDAVIQAARNSRVLITVEEHSMFGGLGKACAAVLMQNRIVLPFHIIGIPDDYTITGDQLEIFDHYSISVSGLAATAQRLLQPEISA